LIDNGILGLHTAKETISSGRFDVLVYKLYGLTEEEIEVVEGL